MSGEQGPAATAGGAGGRRVAVRRGVPRPFSAPATRAAKNGRRAFCRHLTQMQMQFTGAAGGGDAAKEEHEPPTYPTALSRISSL